MIRGKTMYASASTVVSVILSISLLSTAALAQSSTQQIPQSAGPAQQGFHEPSLLLTIGTKLGTSLASVRPTARGFHQLEVGAKWKTPWKSWDRLGLGVGVLFNPDINEYYDPTEYNYAVYVSGHIRRELNTDWALWLAAGPILDCLNCRALVDFGFVANVALEYDSQFAVTIGTQVIAYDLGRPGRPLGTEVSLFGGLRLQGYPAKVGFVPWLLLLGVGILNALPTHS